MWLYLIMVQIFGERSIVITQQNYTSVTCPTWFWQKWVVVIRKMTERHHTCSSGGNLHFHLFAICMIIPISYSAVWNTGRSYFIWFLIVRFCFNMTWKLPHILNLCDNFQFNVIWHRWFVAKCVLCWRLAETAC